MNTVQDWSKFVDLQSTTMLARPADSEMVREQVRSTDAALGWAILENVAIERAVQAFAMTLRWPPLTRSQAFYMYLRLLLAQQVLSEWQMQGEPPVLLGALFVPDLNRRGSLLGWLLIDAWNARGEQHLKDWFARVHDLGRFPD